MPYIVPCHRERNGRIQIVDCHPRLFWGEISLFFFFTQSSLMLSTVYVIIIRMRTVRRRYPAPYPSVYFPRFFFFFFNLVHSPSSVYISHARLLLLFIIKKFSDFRRSFVTRCAEKFKFWKSIDADSLIITKHTHTHTQTQTAALHILCCAIKRVERPAPEKWEDKKKG